MKNKILLYLFIISFFSVSSVHSQITVSPEIGLSYLPFKFYPYNENVETHVIRSRRPTLLLGISARMPIHKKWDANLRISYTNRNDLQWVDTRSGVARLDTEYEWKHQDLNIDVNFHYQLDEKVSIGMGPSLIRSFLEFSQQHNGEDIYPLQKRSLYFFGLNSGISIKMKRINVNLMYLRTRRYNGKLSWHVPNGDNRIDLTIGYRIGKGR